MEETATITILSREVLDDIRSAAWLESETHPDSNLHQRHEMADICERDNIERVWRLLGVCDSEVRLTLRKMLKLRDDKIQQNDLIRTDSWVYEFRSCLLPNVAAYLKEKIHEFMVASVMSDRMKVFLPAAANSWTARRKEAIDEIFGAAGIPTEYKPVRRPLLPF